MKNKIIAGIIVFCAIIGGCLAIKSATTIGQGEVGVVWTAWNGAKDEVLTTGIHFVHPLAKVKKFPIYQQRIVFSNNPEDYNTKDHPDWHIDAPADGGIIGINVNVDYHFNADRAVELYSRFNGMDGEAIVENKVQNSIIGYIKEVTPRFTVMEIYSEKRAEVNAAITEYLNSKLNEEYGINITNAQIIDAQPDEALKEKILAKERAKQDAEKAELDKQTALAQAETDKVKAEAAATVAIETARGEAEANRLISQSITSELIQMKEAEARLKHGWITIQGASTVVTTDADK